MDINAVRANVAARVQVADDTIRPDIIDGIHDNLALALDVITAPTWKKAADGSTSFGHKIYISSLERDHHPDNTPEYGEEPGGPENHGHTNGWSCDVAIIDGVEVGPNHTTACFIMELIAHNKHVNKVGSMAVLINRPDIQQLAQNHGVILFVDEGTGPHVHFQAF